MTASTWTPDRTVTARFADLSGDRNPIHLEAAAAQAAGFEDVVVHGMCVLGVAAQAACNFAPAGQVLRAIDARFAGPVLPGQKLTLDGAAKPPRNGLVKVGLKLTLEAGNSVMSPANFSFGDPAEAMPPGRRVVTERSDDDVVGDSFRFSAAQMADYTDLVAPTPGPEAGPVPPMAVLLGLTDALAKAFKGHEPTRPGMWVHLRQIGEFYQPIEADTDYQCRIMNRHTVVRNGQAGTMLTIPLTVWRQRDDVLVASGSCVLLYTFTEQEEG